MAHLVRSFCLFLIFIFGASEGCPVIVEKGQPTNLECIPSNTAKNVTWQLVVNGTAVTITTCSFDDNKCTDSDTSQYRGYISKTSGGNIASLNITRSRVNETQFKCLIDNQTNIDPCLLEVYAWPKNPVCTKNVTISFTDITCTTMNFYPMANAVIYRREANLTKDDIQPGYPQVSVSAPGEGSDGDLRASYTWRFPTLNRLVNTFYVEMTSKVSNVSAINQTAAISDDIVVKLNVPVVALRVTDCPVDHYRVPVSVFKSSTNSTCKCTLTPIGSPSGFARWYTKDNTTTGVENMQDGSSTLMFNYNSSDPIQAYECRPVTVLSEPVIGVSFIPRFADCITLANVGDHTSTICNVTKNEPSVTWQLVDGKNAVNISTCNFLNKTCSNSTLSNYRVFVTGANNSNAAQLSIISLKADETYFRCLTENGRKVDLYCEVQIRGGVTKPKCSHNVTNTVVEITCTTQSDTFNVEKEIYRKEVNLSRSDADYLCGTNGFNGQYNTSCTWRIALSKMILNSTIYVAFSVKSSVFWIYTPRVTSGDIVTNLTVPEVTIDPKNCPSINGNPIKIGTNSSCVCQLKSPGYPPGIARWFNHDNRIVGEEDSLSGSSTITVSYDDFDPYYTCQAVTPLKANVTILRYSPKFTSSAPRIAVFGIQAVVTVLGAVFFGLTTPSM